MKNLDNFRIKIFADGADLDSISNLNNKSYIHGFTTNPSLMRKAEVKDYKNFALDILKIVTEKPISFEVFADDIELMEAQALEISTWGKNVNVKIPITNTEGKSTVDLLKKLSDKGVVCNVTAIFTLEQVNSVLEVLNVKIPAILSIFAGRIADSGVDPIKIMRDSVELAKSKPNASILWASTRELLNIFQAEKAGCQIITVPHDILKKLSGIGKKPEQNSLETVSTFYEDAKAAGYTIKTKNEI